MAYVSLCRLPPWPIPRGSRDQRRATGSAPDGHRPHGADIPRSSGRGRTADTRDGQAKRGRLDTGGALLCAFFTGNNNHCCSVIDFVISEWCGALWVCGSDLAAGSWRILVVLVKLFRRRSGRLGGTQIARVERKLLRWLYSRALSLNVANLVVIQCTCRGSYLYDVHVSSVICFGI